MGPLIRMEEMEDYVAHGVVIDKDLSTKQRRIVASQKIKTGTIIQEVDPILAIVDKQNASKYCSWCFRANNPKQADSKGNDDDPDSFVPTITLRSCSRCHFTYYCNQEC